MVEEALQPTPHLGLSGRLVVPCSRACERCLCLIDNHVALLCEERFRAHRFDRTGGRDARTPPAEREGRTRLTAK